MPNLHVRISDEQEEIIKKKAEKAGLSVSDYARIVCLNADIKVVVNVPKLRNSK